MPLSEHSRDGLRHVIAANRGGDPATDQCEIAVQGKPKVAWKSGMHHELTETVCGSILKLVPMFPEMEYQPLSLVEKYSKTSCSPEKAISLIR